MRNLKTSYILAITTLPGGALVILVGYLVPSGLLQLIGTVLMAVGTICYLFGLSKG